MNEVNENVTVNGVGTQDEEPVAKNNETKAEKFIRLGEYRMNKAIDAIGRLEHLAWIFCFVRATIPVLGEPVFRLALIHFDFA